MAPDPQSPTELEAHRAKRHKPSTQDDLSTTKALSTAEILEMILSFTDMRTLLTSAQRVCHIWKALIANSPSLQKALFFTPLEPSEWDADVEGCMGQLNPLLSTAFPSLFPPADGDEKRSRWCGLKFTDFSMAQSDSSMAQFTRPDASWRRMLVQQPPIPGIGHFNLRHARGGDSGDIYRIPVDPNLPGLRMERLLDVLLYTKEVALVQHTSARLIWSQEQAEFGDYSRKASKEFERLMKKFGVVLYTEKVVQCMKGYVGRPTVSSRTRREIIRAYMEHGIDVDEREKEITGGRKKIKGFSQS
ncbi:hypothetical protein BJY04DRAFT_225873 [Aspergillus karnatakaensis]|uniref:uncharacterized protein n=1 Tax=Aspergillus karnatakaensis TaxID=1810916 RepID=UPI003CCDF02B